MAHIAPLPASRLHATFDPARIPWEDSSAIPASRAGTGRANPFQPRAMQALDLALQIRATGYNVYLSGEADLGRSYMLLNYLRPRARRGATPPDLVYVQNFADPDRPRLLSLPAGQGKKFKNCLKDMMDAIGRELTRRFETSAYVRQRARLMERFQKVRMGLIHKMNDVAALKGFNLDVDENGGLTLFPLVKGKRLSEEEYGRLDNALRLDLKRRGDSLAGKMAGFLRQMNKAEESFRNDERELELQAMDQVLDAQLTPARERMLKACPTEAMKAYFSGLREDILRNTEAFLPRETTSGQPEAHGQPPADDCFYRYEVNLFVDNGDLAGAPIVVEDNPTALNLLGCVERESEMGALVTDFTLIRAGSLHKANGGFLVLHMEDILQHPGAWEGLLRALRANQAR
ncbi:ATP-binding protein, partial [uncultured Desulfovibrio sp.]